MDIYEGVPLEPMVIINSPDYDQDESEFCSNIRTLRRRYKNEENKKTALKIGMTLLHEPYAKRKSSPLEMCHICNKYFRRMKSHLKKHQILLNIETSGELVCKICKKVFNNKSNLLIHERTHNGDKPYVCDVCNKAFSQSCNLVNHVRIHTGEKPFKCPYCDKAFTQSGNLNNHIRLHTAEKPFKCHLCDKAFVQSGNLNSHIRNNHITKSDNKS